MKGTFIYSKQHIYTFYGVALCNAEMPVQFWLSARITLSPSQIKRFGQHNAFRLIKAEGKVKEIIFHSLILLCVRILLSQILNVIKSFCKCAHLKNKESFIFHFILIGRNAVFILEGFAQVEFIAKAVQFGHF